MVGYDAGKRIKGRKRTLRLARPLGLMLRIEVPSADLQDRDGAALVLDHITRRFPFLERISAEAGYQGRASPQPRRAPSRSSSAPTPAFVRPKRWVIERTLRLNLHQPPPRPRRQARRRDRQSLSSRSL